jgi:hypothetical protein
VISRLVAGITGDPQGTEKAWVVVSSSQNRNRAESDFQNAGADLSKVVFITLPTDSVWMRDYGPQFVWIDDTVAVVDSRYFTSRPADNFVPRLLAEDALVLPSYDMGLYHFGGNFLAGPDGQGFVTDIVNSSNGPFGPAGVAEQFARFQGVSTLHVFPTLPSSVDATGHIDMWFQLVDADTVVISQFLPGSDPSAISITDAAAQYMQQLGFEVFRLPDHDGPHPQASNTHFTYTNAFRVNGKIFVPTYGGTHAARDAQALAIWQQAAPGVQIVPIDAWDLVYQAGVLHCVTMQVPRRAAPAPAASVISPTTGDVLVPGASTSIEWSATDDDAVASVDLLYSSDGGASWATIAASVPNTRQYPWTVPDDLSLDARVRVVARDGVGQTGEAASPGASSIVHAARHVYDFSTGAGTTRRAFGHQVAVWNGISGYRLPPNLTQELSAADYQALSAPDATGGDGDLNRFRPPVPSSGYVATHVFEFMLDEPPSTMREIELVWEGYGDSCLQLELYLWDRVANQWCDGAGSCGEKHYVDAAAGNRDVRMRGTIRQDFGRYVDAQGRLTLLVRAVAGVQATFHDYVAVTVTHGVDADSDGVADAGDCSPVDPTSWSVPGEVESLHAEPEAAGTRLSWSEPPGLGGQSVSYDLLALPAPDAFTLADCVVSGAPGTSALDVDDPAPDALRAYLVRARSGCGPGSVGAGTGGAPRNVPASCP